VVFFSETRNLKNVFIAFNFLDTDFGVYFSARRESLNVSRSEVSTCSGSTLFFPCKNPISCSRSALYARIVEGEHIMDF